MITLLQFDTTDFWKLQWYYPVTITISLIGIYIAYKNYSKKNGSKDSEKLINNNTVPITIHNNNNFTSENLMPSTKQANNTQDDRKKHEVKILFVDDNYADYKMVSILKKAGWINTRGVKDITDLDNVIVVESDIIFVDINGVGTTMFEDQGLGLATALKSRYPKKKIVLYSAETQGNRFHKALRHVDDCLSKNAEPYQFIELIENLIKDF